MQSARKAKQDATKPAAYRFLAVKLARFALVGHNALATHSRSIHIDAIPEAGIVSDFATRETVHVRAAAIREIQHEVR